MESLMCYHHRIVLMVLLSQPDEEIAFSRMEDIVYELIPAYLH